MRRLAFLVPLLPILDLIGLFVVGGYLGFARTVGLLLVAGFLGVWVIRRAGARVATGRSPEEGLVSSGLLLVAGLLLLFPGFLTDAIALLLLVPPVRRLVAARLASGSGVHISFGGFAFGGFGGFGAGDPDGGRDDAGDGVIDVEPGPEQPRAPAPPPRRLPR